MHPEILKFWTDGGHEIGFVDSRYYLFTKGKYRQFPAAFYNTKESVEERKLQYYYPDTDKWYYESTMLKMIRLKAFL